MKNKLHFQLTKLRYWLALLLFTTLGGCYPKGAEYVDELDLVYTNYDTQFAFSTKHTYSLPDSVIQITGDLFTNPNGNGKPTFLSATYSVPILAQIQQNMAAYGWTLVNKNSNPDVVLLTSSITTTNVYYYYDWDYWGWWYPGWIPTWDWYYPGYYYPVSVSGYRTGSVFIQMVDNKSIAATAKLSIAWNCILNGIAEGGSSSIVPRIQAGINQAFSQSPYLKH